jgi:hypothetical protein
MIKFTLPKSFLFALFLFLGAANLPAQDDQEMRPAPIPSVIPAPPPAVDTLPPPPHIGWAPLGPKEGGDEGGGTEVTLVPPPVVETAVAPPPPVVETPVTGLPAPAETEFLKPDVEVWRPEGELPQIPGRRPNQLEQAYITGTEPVWLRVQFDPLAAGKRVYVRPGTGVTIGNADAVLTVTPSGECLLSAQLDENFPRGHIIFYCDGVKTVLPLVRASLPKVQENEALTGGG